MNENTIETNIDNKKGVIMQLLDDFSSSYNYLLQFIHGALLTLAFHPFDIFITIPVAFSGFLWCLERDLTSSQAMKRLFFSLGFKHAFIFYLGHFFSSLYWVSNPLFFDLHAYWFLIPFALIILPAFLSLFYSFASALICTYYILPNVQNLCTSNKIKIALLFSIGFFISEILRANFLIQFPWNLLGYASGYSLSLMQLASITGVYGLSMLLYLVGTVPYTKNLFSISFITILVIVITMYGNKRLNSIEVSNDKKLSVTLYVVQPNLEHHYNKYDKQIEALEKTKKIVTDHIATKSSKISNELNINMIILPESAIPFVLNKYQSILFDDLMSTYTTNSFLLSGIDRYDSATASYYNSIILINNHGEILDSYDKIILTPFGEYIPGYDILKPILKPIVGNHFGFSPGIKTRNIILHFDGVHKITDHVIIMPMICFESIFTPLSFTRDDDKVDLIVNVTNDSWLGRTIGPYQHLAMSRMRAIEYGLPFVRAAKTGISAVFNSYGQLIRKIDLNMEGVIIVEMPQMKVQTPYMEFVKLFRSDE